MTDQEYKDMIHGIVVPATLSDEETAKRYQPLVDFLQKETPKMLYRFRQCNERSLDAFDQDKLFFSPPAEMNDSFDSMLYFSREQIDSALKRSAESETVQSLLVSVRQGGEVPDTIRNAFSDSPEVLDVISERIAQMSPADAQKHMELFQSFFGNQLDIYASEIAQIVQQSIKAACFSENINSAAMWGYYADSGKGFALAYSFCDGNYISKDYCLARVIYDDERYDASEYAAWLLARKLFFNLGIISPSNNSPQYMLPCPDMFMHTKVLLHKAKAWSHEQEWRLTFSGNSADDHPYILKRPSAIYLGRNVSAIHEKILRHIAVERGIPTYKMVIRKDNLTYNLFPEPI